MEVIQVSEILKVIIEYDNSASSEERDEVYKYLDETYGKLNWKIKRNGPKVDCLEIGLIIVEVDKNWRN